MSNATSPDPRINAYRRDLADITLSAVVKAERYVEPTLRQCVRGVVPLLEAPRADAKQVSQIRYGEFVDVFEVRKDGFIWVQNRSDRYVGYMPAIDELSEEIADLSTRVAVLQTFIYPEPNLKAPPVDEVTLGSYVRFRKQVKGFAELADGGYIFAKHLAPATDMKTPDYVFTAGRLLGVPYLWGGRTPKGIDCSGLVQLSLELASIDVPRDSDQQRVALGHELPCHWRDFAWKRGDIVFFPGHVGFMTGIDHLIHASAFDMKVTVEPLLDVVARGVNITAMGRLQK
jgi:cell wall-associated NlpC family hydrolase